MRPMQQLRRELRAARLAIPPRQQRHHSLSVSRHLAQWPAFRHAERIAVYIASGGELALDPVIADIRAAGKTPYLPLLHPFAGNKLWFSQWREEDRLQPNRYAIPEPVAKYRKPMPAFHLDMVLMPLVAFDAHCHRLGMGGGYYDRSFAYRKRHPSLRKPLLVGVAHQLQQIDELMVRPWDVAVDAVVTEAGLCRC